MSKNKTLNLEDCFKKFEEVETLEGKDLVRCGHCEEETPHTLECKMQHPPPILIIHLKRFHFESSTKTKIQKLVDFPLYNLDLSDHLAFPSLNTETTLYDLYAVVNH